MIDREKQGEYKLIRASYSDAAIAAMIYDRVRGKDGSVWDDGYPTLSHATADAEAGCLYLLYEGAIAVGCVSVEPISEDNDLAFWEIRDETHREISRVAIIPERRGRSLSGKMVSMLLELLRESGVRSVHLLCAVQNEAAKRVYESLGFVFRGECFRYGHDYLGYEMIL